MQGLRRPLVSSISTVVCDGRLVALESFNRVRLSDAGGRMNLTEADLGMVASVALHEIKNNYFQHVSASP